MFGSGLVELVIEVQLLGEYVAPVGTRKGVHSEEVAVGHFGFVMHFTDRPGSGLGLGFRVANQVRPNPNPST